MAALAIDGFVASRSVEWAELDSICARIEGGSPLDPATVLRLGQLYREAVADLAVARRRFAGAPLVARLEELVSTARDVVYDAPRRASLLPLLRFATRGWWRLLALSWRWTLGAAGVFIGLTVVVATWAAEDPLEAGRTLPVALRRIPLTPHDTIRQAVGLPRGVPQLDNSWTALAALVLAIFAIAGGLLAGVGTVVVLGLGALQLGVPIGLALHAGESSTILRLIAANGALLAIIVALAGGQGLRVGATVIGRRGAPQQAGSSGVADAGQQAALVLAGSLPFLAAAAGLQALAGTSPGVGPVVPLGLLAITALIAGTVLLGVPPDRHHP